MRVALIIGAIVLVLGLGFLAAMGPGAISRNITLGGLYSVCKPGGYDVVCFGDKAGKDGGVSCVPLQLAGGKCQ
jgi:hypothetical protein